MATRKSCTASLSGALCRASSSFGTRCIQCVKPRCAGGVPGTGAAVAMSTSWNRPAPRWDAAPTERNPLAYPCVLGEYRGAVENLGRTRPDAYGDELERPYPLPVT